MNDIQSGFRRGSVSVGAVITLVASLILSAFCFHQAVTPPAASDETVPTVTSPAAEKTTDFALKPIETLRPGERVIGLNPDGKFDTSLGTRVEPASWKQLTLKASKLDGGEADVVMLRPDWWLQEHNAISGSSITLYVPECGISGDAQVLSIEQCPQIPDGDDPVVISTFRHESSEIVEVFVADQPDPIGTTVNHPFWSEDRQDFVAAASLQPGEQLRTLDGTAFVSEVRQTGETEPVFNLEVLGQHVYHVADSGILVHNNCNEIVVQLEVFFVQQPRGKPIALGLRDNLVEFGHKVRGVIWTNWKKKRLTPTTDPTDYTRFNEAFWEAANNTRQINFNLDGISLSRAVSNSDGWVVNDNFTNLELKTIFTHDEFLKKTIFYKDGRIWFTGNDILNAVPIPGF